MSDNTKADKSPIRFSVIVPLYNKEQSVSSSIESILGQTYQDFELIIVDDGSTDESLAAVKKYDDDRIKIESQVNQGVSVARNRGAELAQSDYLAFIDADDMWHPSYLHVIAQMMELKPGSECYGTAWAAWSQNDEIPKQEHVFDAGEVRFADFLSESLDDVIVHIGSLVISRAAFMAVGGFPAGVKFFEDQDLNSKLAVRAPFVFYKTPMMYYVRDAENRACSIRSVQEMPPFFTECEGMMQQNHGRGTQEWHLKEFMVSRYLNEVSLACQTSGERLRALKLLWVCRKTRASQVRFWKSAVYMLLPPRLITYLLTLLQKR